jgi:hypothetical protein
MMQGGSEAPAGPGAGAPDRGVSAVARAGVSGRLTSFAKVLQTTFPSNRSRPGQREAKRPEPPTQVRSHFTAPDAAAWAAGPAPAPHGGDRCATKALSAPAGRPSPSGRRDAIAQFPGVRGAAPGGLRRRPQIIRNVTQNPRRPQLRAARELPLIATKRPRHGPAAARGGSRHPHPPRGPGPTERPPATPRRSRWRPAHHAPNPGFAREKALSSPPRLRVEKSRESRPGRRGSGKTLPAAARRTALAGADRGSA